MPTQKETKNSFKIEAETKLDFKIERKMMELWLSGLSARSGLREVPGSSPVSSYSCEDNFSQLNP